LMHITLWSWRRLHVIRMFAHLVSSANINVVELLLATGKSES
jgi:hypothetical protein